MSDADIRRYTAEELDAKIARGEDQTDWERLRSKTEAELEADIASDPDWADLPEDWLLSPDAVVVRAGAKLPVAVDPEIAVWFLHQGGNFEARINEVLRTYIREHSEA